jgi:hypothetical protein
VTCDGVSSDLPLRDISVKKMQMRDMILIRLVDHMTSLIRLVDHMTSLIRLVDHMTSLIRLVDHMTSLIRLVDHMTSTITLFTTCIYILIKQFLCFLLQKSFTDYMPGDSISIVVKNTEKEIDSLFKR